MSIVQPSYSVRMGGERCRKTKEVRSEIGRKKRAG